MTLKEISFKDDVNASYISTKYLEVMSLVKKLQQTLFRRRGVQSVESFELLVNEYRLSLPCENAVIMLRGQKHWRVRSHYTVWFVLYYGK